MYVSPLFDAGRRRDRTIGFGVVGRWTVGRRIYVSDGDAVTRCGMEHLMKRHLLLVHSGRRVRTGRACGSREWWYLDEPIVGREDMGNGFFWSSIEVEH